jgi:transposase
MAGKDIIEMSLGELRRLKAAQEAIDRHITQKSAASMTGLSERQLRRLVRAVRDGGDRGVIHKARGRPSRRKLPEKIKDKALRFYKRKYKGFGPTLASEKLMEFDGIKLSEETLRKWLMEAGLWKRRPKRASHRQWRPSVYLDRHTTYKSPKKPTPEEELAGMEEPMSQFERALEELGAGHTCRPAPGQGQG